jgi:hypothetical protein
MISNIAAISPARTQRYSVEWLEEEIIKYSITEEQL